MKTIFLKKQDYLTFAELNLTGSFRTFARHLLRVSKSRKSKTKQRLRISDQPNRYVDRHLYLYFTKISNDKI